MTLLFYEGLNCSSSNSTIEAITLGNRGLYGEFDQSSLAAFEDMMTFSVPSNSIFGSVPSSLFQLQKLQDVKFQGNSLSGEISPQSIGSASILYFNASDNQLSGSLSFVCKLENLIVLNLRRNKFTGSLSSDISKLTKLSLLEIGYNEIGGTLPPDVSSLTALIVLAMESNRFEGSVHTLSKLSKLNILRLDSNKFTGSLDNLLSEMHELQVLDLGSNLFTGTIPSAVFYLNDLKSLSLTKNLFHGQISADFCNLKDLKALILDGLTSGLGSRTSNYMLGGLPSCLFSMTNLEVLRASGNGLNGPIAEIIPLSPMSYLSLSHNRLTGTIPLGIQSKNFSSLLLDNNRFEGEFQPNPIASQKSDSVIKINYNRLSGLLSSEFLNYKTAEILVGNIWYCDQEALPTSDPNHLDYDCSTELYHNSLIVWGTIGGIIGVIYIIVWWAVRREAKDLPPHDPNAKSMSEYLGLIYLYVTNFSVFATKAAQKFDKWSKGLDEWTEEIGEIKGFLYIMQYLMRTSIMIAALLLLLVCPIFSQMKKVGYGTHKIQYFWEVSGAYLSGMASGGVFFMIWTIAAGILIWRLVRAHNKVLRTIKYKKPTIKKNEEVVARDVRYLTYIACASLLCFSAAVVVGVNILYVVSSSVFTTQQQMAVLLFVAVFKMTWSIFTVPLMIALIREKVYLRKTWWLRLKVILILFNTIVAPFLASIFISKQCFQPFIFGAEIIEPYQYNYSFCFHVSSSDECQEYLSESNYLTFTPPFIYNHLCSSVLFSYYVPIYLYVYVFFSFGIPFGYVVLATTPSEKFYDFMLYVLPGILWPRDENPERFQFLFDPDDVTASQLQHLTTLLTFGVVSPCLAVAISITMCMEMYTWQVLLGRYVTQRQEKMESDRESKTEAEVKLEFLHTFGNLNKTCTEAWRRPLSCGWLVFWVSALFFIFVTYDISTDTSTLSTSAWLPVLIVSVPFFLWVYKKKNLQFLKPEDLRKRISSVVVGQLRTDKIDSDRIKKDIDSQQSRGDIRNPIVKDSAARDKEREAFKRAHNVSKDDKHKNLHEGDVELGPEAASIRPNFDGHDVSSSDSDTKKSHGVKQLRFHEEVENIKHHDSGDNDHEISDEEKYDESGEDGDHEEYHDRGDLKFSFDKPSTPSQQEN